jgi:hypothetical protein
MPAAVPVDLHFSVLPSEDLVQPNGRAKSAPVANGRDSPALLLNFENTVRELFLVGDAETVGDTTRIERIDTEGTSRFKTT